MASRKNDMSDPAATPSQTLSIGITTDVGDVANALAAIFKMGDAIFETLNSPAILALRQRQDIQDALAGMDQTLKQAQGGDKNALQKLDQEASA